MKISQHLQRAGYDTIVSWLTVLHFADRAQLFKQCYEVNHWGLWGVLWERGADVATLILASHLFTTDSQAGRRFFRRRLFRVVHADRGGDEGVASMV